MTITISPLRLTLFIAIALTALYAFGQASYGSLSYGTIAPLVSNCPAPMASGTTLCTVGSSTGPYTIYVAFNGGTYAPLVPPPATAGVASFNGRTGAVVLSASDVSGTGVKATATVTVNSTIQ